MGIKPVKRSALKPHPDFKAVALKWHYLLYRKLHLCQATFQFSYPTALLCSVYLPDALRCSHMSQPSLISNLDTYLCLVIILTSPFHTLTFCRPCQVLILPPISLRQNIPQPISTHTLSNCQ